MTVKNQLLKCMGIIKWTLHNPTVLHGQHAVCIPNSTKLIIISNERTNLENIFIEDILRSMKIDSRQVHCLLTKEISLLPKEIIWPCWIIGKKLDIFSKKWIINSLSLEKIYFNPQLKRDLWNQICYYTNKYKEN
ncbi:MAG: DNA polymerase III subunit psi [Arsenophonus sp.]